MPGRTVFPFHYDWRLSAHLVLIAPAQLGVVDAFRILVRPERFLRRVFTTEMVETWPSVPELLPENGRFVIGEGGKPVAFDAWDPRTWHSLIRTTPRFERLIAAGRRFRDDLRDATMPANVKVSESGAVTKGALLRRSSSPATEPCRSAALGPAVAR